MSEGERVEWEELDQVTLMWLSRPSLGLNDGVAAVPECEPQSGPPSQHVPAQWPGSIGATQ